MNDYTDLINAINSLSLAVRGCGVALMFIFCVLLFKNTNSDYEIKQLKEAIASELKQIRNKIKY